MAKRHLTQYDSSGNKQEIYLNDDEVMTDGKTLGEKLDEIDEALGDAGSGSVNGVQVGETTYRPNQNGVVDLSTPLDGKVDKETGKGLSSNDYTTQERNKLAGLSNYDDTALQAAVVSLQNALAALVGGADVQGAIDTFNEVVAFLSGISSSDTLAAKLATLVPQTRTVNGKALSSNVTIGINDIEGLAAAIAAAGSGAVSVTVPDPADGTFTINVGDNSFTVNLNHTHENMAKLVVCEESDLPSTLDPATIYAITDSGETEIEKLIIRGMEFAGGGVPDTGEPMISSPSNGSTINLGENSGSGVSKTITIKGKHLTGDLTVAVGTGLELSYGQTLNASSVTIPMAQALLGAQVTISYSGSGALADGSLVISHGNDVLSTVVVVVVEYFPAGYTKLSSISGITDFITTNINAQGTTWEIDASAGSQTTFTELLIGYGDPATLPAGSIAIGAINGYWSLGGGINAAVQKTVRSIIIVSFTSSGATMTIGNETISRAGSSLTNGPVTIFGANLQGAGNYLLQGSIYSVKCTAGGSFNGVPAKRNSDNKEGIYDLSNDVFYPLK